MAPSAIFPYTNLRALALLSLEKWVKNKQIESLFTEQDLQDAVGAFIQRSMAPDGGATARQLLTHSRTLLLTETEGTPEFDMFKTMITLLKEIIDTAESDEDESDEESDNVKAENRELKIRVAELKEAVAYYRADIKNLREARSQVDKRIEQLEAGSGNRRSRRSIREYGYKKQQDEDMEDVEEHLKNVEIEKGEVKSEGEDGEDEGTDWKNKIPNDHQDSDEDYEDDYDKA